jgi:hypothetical protein
MNINQHWVPEICRALFTLFHGRCDSRVLINSSYIFWLANLQSSSTPDRDGGSQVPRCLDQREFHADECLSMDS